MACILEELENTLKKQLGNTKNSKEFKDGTTKAKERVAELSTLLNEVGAMKKVMQGQVNTETNVQTKVKVLEDMLNKSEQSKLKTMVDNIIADKNIDKVHNKTGQTGIAFGPVEYSYSNGRYSHKQKDMPKEISELAKQIGETLGRTKDYYNHVLINKFEDGIGIGMHPDNEPIYKDTNGAIGAVAIYSIGSTKVPHIIENEKYTAKNNSLVEMASGSMYHSVGAADGVRYSFTFRHIPENNLPKKPTSVDGGLVNNKGFNGYVPIKDTGGKGSVEGDAKDIAMREVADGFVGEISNGRLNNSSTGTSYNALKDNVSGPTSAGSITYHGAAKPSTVMLARNGSFRGKPLNSETKEAIEYYFQEGASFVVGDMPGVDSQFIDYLDEIGASYKIYHTGSSPRIVKEDIKYQKGTKESTKQETDIIVPTEVFTNNLNKIIDCKSKNIT